jgi:arginine:pyruvate transaminase
MNSEYQSRRDLVVSRLQGIRGVRPLVPDGGLFVMVDLRELMEGSAAASFTSDDVRKFLLEQHGVVVLHGGAFGPGGEGMLRVSFAAGGPALDKGLERLRAGLIDVASGAWQKPKP